jgi:nucleotide-binding universal stress UspA family protein
MQLNRVVVGVDFSEPSEAAARWTAAHLARGAELVLVHAVDVPEPPSFLRGRFPPRERLVETARTGADKRLRELSLALGAERIWLEVREGDAAEQLAAVAAEYGADLVVVGAHGMRPGPWIRVGSTAEQITRRSPAPVLLAQGALDAPPRRLLVGLDDASIAQGVLGWARLLAERCGARVTALHVLSAPLLESLLTLAAVTSGTPTPTIPALESGHREDADRWARRVVEGGLDAATASSEIAFGDPAPELLAAAQRVRADLILVGRHGAGGARPALLGSVTSEVLRGATCPVLVVMEPPRT